MSYINCVSGESEKRKTNHKNCGDLEFGTWLSINRGAD